jgi:hypothetical protein
MKLLHSNVKPNITNKLLLNINYEVYNNFIPIGMKALINFLKHFMLKLTMK